MALGKYSKVDGRKLSSNYCYRVTLVAFVALCLVGVWMMASSYVVPFQNIYTTTYGNNNDVIKIGSTESKVINNSSKENSASSEDATTIKANISKQFEDNPGDLPEHAINGDTIVNSQEDINNPNENSNENTQVHETKSKGDAHGKQEEKPTRLEDTSTTEIAKGMEKKEDEESKAEDKDSIVAKTISDSEGRISGIQVENHDDGKGTTYGNNPDAEKKVEEEKKNNEEKVDAASNEIFPSRARSEILNETSTQNGSFSTQETESRKVKEGLNRAEPEPNIGYQWKLCNVTSGSDFIPCLDNLKAIKSLQTTNHYEHRERHCPLDPPTCLVSLPEGYQRPIQWPTSRQKVY
ncbi:hypothetical protein L6452_02022 [Arctium lappa]|uniref:Uncharacterized protein n=1 Tax=Arctium lappa TaxID=4217 RepID=A0ACB9FHQ5_ARCLA|nr:hypothetical protein L6452_02022 [Arctium lappa]